MEDSTTAFRGSSAATIVVVHDRADAWALADRVVVLLDGRIVADGGRNSCSPHRRPRRWPASSGTTAPCRRATTVTLTRSPHVAIDEAGDLEATVLRVVRREDGARVQLQLPSGTVWAEVRRTGAEPVGLAVGDVVRARLLGGVTFREGD